MDYVITRTQLDAAGTKYLDAVQYYDGAGHKLRRTVNSGGIIETTDYAGNAVYDGFSLAMLQIPGGYVTLSGTTPTYHYYQKDHLGSNRLVTRATGTVEQIVHYYPFGGQFGDGTAPALQQYKFTGKELDNALDAHLYDFGARSYDPALMRWSTPDPLMGKYPSLSPYTYCANSPANIVDPNGMEIRGNTKEDIELVIKDLRTIFSDSVFDKLKDLLIRTGEKKNGLSLSKITEEQLSQAFEGIDLSNDQFALMKIVVNTINSDDVHIIEYVSSDDGVASPSAEKAFINGFADGPLKDFLPNILKKSNGLPLKLLSNEGGGGITSKTKTGSYSIIFINGQHPNGQAVTMGHELFGHGRSLALGVVNQHEAAIQTENLILRVMGIVFQNTGFNHGPRTKINNPSALPSFR